ncbi:MAG: hypothetical protein QF441_16950 [Bacteriovoracaceae bacterium]|jgi:cytoskeletal protein CcmA (bactofilin family)|nr:hypothetical protein [Halobacteriovoraceae bacterium]MDP7322294.1 hypothetical protein [Bacteriovoracaceae bacterium]|tara:strand:- start:378 stop:668 length:291 start_codon:yes stop_codon:yes gene_type:complete
MKKLISILALSLSCHSFAMISCSGAGVTANIDAGKMTISGTYNGVVESLNINLDEYSGRVTNGNIRQATVVVDGANSELIVLTRDGRSKRLNMTCD